MALERVRRMTTKEVIMDKWTRNTLLLSMWFYKIGRLQWDASLKAESGNRICKGTGTVTMQLQHLYLYNENILRQALEAEQVPEHILTLRIPRSMFLFCIWQKLNARGFVTSHLDLEVLSVTHRNTAGSLGTSRQYLVKWTVARYQWLHALTQDSRWVLRNKKKLHGSSPERYNKARNQNQVPNQKSPLQHK